MELGMNTEDFHLCTWYEWSLKLERVRHIRKKRHEDHELLMEMVRQTLAYYWNWNSTKKITPSDIWPLSYDRPDTQVEEKDKAMVQETVERLERIAKKKKRG